MVDLAKKLQTPRSRTRRLIFALSALFVALPFATAFAHSVEDLEQDLSAREQFFQQIDKPAPNFSLLNERGEPVALADLRGKVVVLHFIYTNCPDVCPLHAERIAEIQGLVNQTPTKELVEFVTVTTDPSRDTYDVMRRFGEQHGLDAANWTFLTSGPERPEDTTRKLAEAFGHKFTLEDDGYQMHGIVTHIIDKNGQWRANFHGLDFKPINLVVFINGLANDYPHAHPGERKSIWEKLKALF